MSVINEEMDADFTILTALHRFLTQDKVTSFSWGVVGDVLLAVCVGPLSTILNVFSERHFDLIFETNAAYVMGITPFCLLLPMPETKEHVPSEWQSILEINV